ncbi:MAG: hypothetical protein OXD37_10480 [Acidimicrobiaceae bacterium]|nr:hypothetical protein [Acidimicrobiaceae bacterium]MCY4279409.1 hypothetical protein [Acidimicrobiaceae bacterium]MCY4294103.1 hypothetical protein [Acidimicrobiaceae bacterium]
MSINAKVSIAAVLSFHWCVFWLLNGFDKFFNADHFFGANFKALLENDLLGRLDLDSSLAWPIAIIVGICELILGLAFLFALIAALGRKAETVKLIGVCVTLSVLFFALLSAGAVLFGARDALQQHGVFIAALLASQFVVSSVSSD